MSENTKKESEYLTKSIDLSNDLKNLRIKHDEDLAKLRAQIANKESDYQSKSSNMIW